MWATNYEWLWILSSISNPYSTFYDSTYLFDYCYYPLMTIVWYQPLMAVLALGRMVSFISIGHFLYNEFPSDYSSKPLFSLCYSQHHSLCEHHHNETGFVNDLWLFYQQPTSEWSSLSLTCQRNTTCNLYCFQNNTQVSFSNAFPLFLRYYHPT